MSSFQPVGRTSGILVLSRQGKPFFPGAPIPDHLLNGDKYKTGKTAPDGSPDPSIFSTEGDPVGIRVGTAIATLVRKTEHAPAGEVGFRHLWGQAKREGLLETAEREPDELYDRIAPIPPRAG